MYLASYNSESVASGAFLISGAWFTISGTLATVRQILDIEQIPAHNVVEAFFVSGVGTVDEVYVIGFKGRHGVRG